MNEAIRKILNNDLLIFEKFIKKTDAIKKMHKNSDLEKHITTEIKNKINKTFLTFEFLKYAKNKTQPTANKKFA
jgi:hypothetical protein